MANIMSQLKLKNSASRNAFDLGRKNAFTAKVGELLPVACIECLPGDKIKARVQHFSRTMPVNTAAFTRIREYFDWYFVPTNLLWNKFNTFVTQMVDNNQHATGITSSQQLTNMHPYFTMNQIATYLKAISSGNNNSVGLSRALQSAKLLEYLNYGNYYPSAKGETQNFRNNLNLNPFPLLAYQKIYQDFYRNSQWENGYAPSFNIDYISGAAQSLNIPTSALWNTASSSPVSSINMFDLQYSNWNKDLFMGVLPNSQYGDAASVILPDPVSTYNVGAMSMHALNLPSEGLTTFSPVGIPVGASSSIGSHNTLKYSINGDTTQMGNFNYSIPSASLNVLRESMGINDFSILALRQAEALQKWREVTQSQQQDYKNQIEAHFNVSPSDALSERCKFIDGSVSSLDISEVTNTNLADENAADIAGRGVGVGDGSMNFSTDVHGYLMCIYHAVPLLDFAIDGVERMNQKTMVTDYAIPEFDKTGMVQVTTDELTSSTSQQSFAKPFLGYAPRYYDYKTSVDRVHGAFVNGGLGAWVAPIDASYLQKYLAVAGIGGVEYKFFKVNPAVLNPIFAQNVDSEVTTDQLLINSNFEITAVRNLDRNGLPY